MLKEQINQAKRSNIKRNIVKAGLVGAGLVGLSGIANAAPSIFWRKEDGSLTNLTNGGTGSGSSTQSFGVTINGSGGVPTTGSMGYIVIPYDCTITKWYIVGDTTGSAIIDLKRSGTSIVGAGNKPTLSGAQRNNSTPSSWTSTSITAYDEIEFNLDSASTLTRINLIMVVEI